MAQVTQESGGVTPLGEGFRYPRGVDTVPVRSARASPDGPAAQRAAMNGDSKPLAELMYGGNESNRLGEGYLYRGLRALSDSANTSLARSSAQWPHTMEQGQQQPPLLTR